MKIKNEVVYLTGVAMAIVIYSCGETKKGKASVSDEKKFERKGIVREEFDSFFKQFSKDSVFQLSRVDFPISYYSADIENNKEEYVYNRDDFWYINFTEDSAAATRNVDAYEPVIEKGDSKTLYIRRGIDNGIRIEYYFEMSDKGKWYLIEIIDNSN